MSLKWNKTNLPTITEKKIQEINLCCEQKIYQGIDVTLANGGKVHFSLTPNDQTNLDSIFNAVVLGAKEYPYHADKNECTLFSAEDIITIYSNYKSFVTYHLTYCNYAKKYIQSLTNKTLIASFNYGDTLPEDFMEKINELLNSASNQVQNIINTISMNKE